MLAWAGNVSSNNKFVAASFSPLIISDATFLCRSPLADVDLYSELKWVTSLGVCSCLLSSGANKFSSKCA